MAEGLATAASGIAVLTVAVQLAQSIKKLSDFWTSIKEAPEDIQAIVTDLGLLSNVLIRIAHEAQHVEPDAILAATLNGCWVKVRRLTALLNEIEPGFASSSLRVRKWTALKAVLKKEHLAKFQGTMDRIKSTLLLVQVDQYSRLSRHQHLSLERSLMVLTQSVSSLSVQQQHSDTARRLSSSVPDVNSSSPLFRVEESDLTKSFAGNLRSIECDYSDLDGPPRGRAWFKRTVQMASSVMECSLGTIRAESNTQLRISAEKDEIMFYNEQDQGEHETSYTVYPAGWLIRLGIRYGLHLKFLSSSTQGWKPTLKPFCPVPDDALIFEFCRQGNTDAVRALLSRGDASVRDTDSDGYTPLHVSLLRHEPLDLVKVSNARFKIAAQNHHPKLCEVLKSAGADMNAFTYDVPTWTPMLLAVTFTNTTHATLSDCFDTIRLLTDSMDFLDTDTQASGWVVLIYLVDNVAREGGKTEVNVALMLWMLKLLTYELKAYYLKSEFARLLRCTLFPEFELEQATDLLLELGDAKIIDAQYGIDGYTVLHNRLGYAIDPEDVSIVLAKGPNLHLQGFDKYYTPEKESPMSLAMYSSWAFTDWLHGLIGIEIDLSTFIVQELESNALVHPGWDQETLHDLFVYPARTDHYFRGLSPCSDCSDCSKAVRIQPFWRHVLERIKQGIDPDNPSQENSGVDETQIPDIISEVEETSHPGHEPDKPVSILLDDSNDEFWPDSESESELELGSDVHGYPENVPIQSDCIYGPYEIVCMDCWLHYRKTGTRLKSKATPRDEYCSSEDESSDDEFSPYHIHS